MDIYKIIIEGKGPRVTGGVTKVVDDVRKGRAMLKEQAEAEFED